VNQSINSKRGHRLTEHRSVFACEVFGAFEAGQRLNCVSIESECQRHRQKRSKHDSFQSNKERIEFSPHTKANDAVDSFSIRPIKLDKVGDKAWTIWEGIAKRIAD
jgi:hypothetical protein